MAGLQHRGVVAGMRARLAFTQLWRRTYKLVVKPLKRAVAIRNHPLVSPERLNQVENWVMPMATFIMLTCKLTRHKRDTFLP